MDYIFTAVKKYGCRLPDSLITFKARKEEIICGADEYTHYETYVNSTVTRLLHSYSSTEGKAISLLAEGAAVFHGAIFSGSDYIDSPEKLKNADPAENYYGMYSYGMVSDYGESYFSSDEIGASPVYYSDEKDYLFVSNNAHLIAQYRRLLGYCVEYEPTLPVWYSAGLSVESDNCGYKDIYRMRPFEYMTVDLHNNVSFKQKNKVDFQESYSALKKKALETCAQAAEALVKKFSCTCNLTGGFDTRLNLAVILEAGLQRKIVFDVEGFDDNPDVIAAKLLAEKYNLKLTVKQPTMQKEKQALRYACLMDDCIRHNIYTCAEKGFLNSGVLLDRDVNTSDVIISGKFGELSRPICAQNYVRIMGKQSLSVPLMFADKGNYYLSNENMLALSSEENVVIFMLDTYSNDIMQQVSAQYPDAFADFKDFTYFENCSTHICGTFYSMVTMLTGYSDYNNEESYTKYLDEAWTNDETVSYYEALHNNGYEVNLYVKSNMIANDAYDLQGLADNVKEGEKSVNKLKMLKYILNLSCYKCLPIAFKPFFWSTSLSQDFIEYGDMSDNFELNDYAFYRNIVTNKLTVSEGAKQFMFYEMAGAHTPLQLNENAEYADDTTQLQQARGALRIISEYMAQLKELGIYDNTTIILLADHGDTIYPTPMVLIKRAGESHSAMITSAAPAQLSDLPATILSILGEDVSGYTGLSMYAIDEATYRERVTYIWGNYDNIPQNGKKYNVLKAHYITEQNVNDHDFKLSPQNVLPLPDSFY